MKRENWESKDRQKPKKNAKADENRVLSNTGGWRGIGKELKGGWRADATVGWSEGLNMSTSVSQTAVSIAEGEWTPSQGQANYTISANNTVSY